MSYSPGIGDPATEIRDMEVPPGWHAPKGEADRFLIFGRVWCRQCRRRQRIEAESFLTHVGDRRTSAMVFHEEHAAFCKHYFLNGGVMMIGGQHG